MKTQIVLSVFFLFGLALSNPFTNTNVTTSLFDDLVDQPGCNRTSSSNQSDYSIGVDGSVDEYVQCIAPGRGYTRKCMTGMVFVDGLEGCWEKILAIKQLESTEKDLQTGSTQNKTVPMPKLWSEKDEGAQFERLVEHDTTTTTQSTVIQSITAVEEIDSSFKRKEPIINETSLSNNVTNDDFVPILVDIYNSTMPANSSELETTANQKRNNWITFMDRRDWFRVSVDVPNCMNTCSSHGICDEFSVDSRCICLMNYKGLECDEQIEKDFEYVEILNNTFRFERYIDLHYWQNGSAKDVNVVAELGRGTVQSRNSMLDEKSEVTFEMFWTEVVDHLFGEIGPEEHFLREVSCGEFRDEQLGSDLQRVYFYAKYANETLKARLDLLEKVLLAVKFVLGQTSNSTSADAVEFLTKWNDQFMPSDDVKKVTRATARLDIQASVISVEATSREIYETYLNRDSEHVIDEPLRVIKLRELVTELKQKSENTWRMIVDYGFWYLTYNLAVDDDQMEVSKDAVNDENVDFFIRKHIQHIHHH